MKLYFSAQTLIFLAIGTIFISSFGNSARAQLTPDNTLGTENSVVTPNVAIDGIPSNKIDGGATRGVNLFHSFEKFNIGEGQGAYFTNPTGIENIFTRVTGNSSSQILGTLGVLGNANLFLINPNGIIFGQNSRLDLRGSFLASTANKINFPDNQQFSTIAGETNSLLSINLPIGLQYGSAESTASIVNQSRTTNTNGNIIGLQVESGKTLALLGGDVVLEGGYLTAPGGRIELGSVGADGLVSLTFTKPGLSMGYEKVANSRNISLSQQALVNANDNGQRSGNIQVNADRVTLSDKSIIVANNILGSQELGEISIDVRNLVLTGGAQISASTLGKGQGGDIRIRAGEAVELSGARADKPFPTNLFIFSGYAPSSLITRAENEGNAGNLTIETNRLNVESGALISASTFGQGKGGTLTIRATDTVNLIGPSPDPTQTLGMGLFAQALNGTGNGGSLIVETGTLNIQDGALASTSTFSAGNAGDLIVRASVVRLSRSLDLPNSVFTGGLFAQVTRGVTGNGGNLTIETDRLIVEGGVPVSVGTRSDSTGQGGTLTVIARESAELTGKTPDGKFSSTLFGRSDGNGNASDLNISAGRLTISNGAEITVSGTGNGNAGNLLISASSIQLDNQGAISARATSGDRGNIILQTQQLQLRHQSAISTDASGNATGGNINITTNTLTALENSDITANADQSFGGRVSITSQGIFGTQFREQEDPGTSDITASSALGAQFSGTVTIQTPEINPNQGLIVLPDNFIDISGSIARTCQAEGSQFVVTGRGGLPPTPFDYLSGNTAWLDLRDPEEAAAELGQKQAFNYREIERSPNQQFSQPETAVVEAKGWKISDRGEVILTAESPAIALYSSWWKQPDCGGRGGV